MQSVIFCTIKNALCNHRYSLLKFLNTVEQCLYKLRSTCNPMQQNKFSLVCTVVILRTFYNKVNNLFDYTWQSSLDRFSTEQCAICLLPNFLHHKYEFHFALDGMVANCTKLGWWHIKSVLPSCDRIDINFWAARICSTVYSQQRGTIRSNPYNRRSRCSGSWQIDFEHAKVGRCRSSASPTARLPADCAASQPLQLSQRRHLWPSVTSGSHWLNSPTVNSCDKAWTGWADLQ